MPKPYSMVIFDCDGVLVDTERLTVRVDAMVLAAMGWPLSGEEIVRRFVGRPHEHMTEQLGRHFGRSLPPDWNRRFPSNLERPRRLSPRPTRHGSA